VDAAAAAAQAAEEAASAAAVMAAAVAAAVEVAEPAVGPISGDLREMQLGEDAERYGPSPAPAPSQEQLSQRQSQPLSSPQRSRPGKQAAVLQASLEVLQGLPAPYRHKGLTQRELKERVKAALGLKRWAELAAKGTATGSVASPAAGAAASSQAAEAKKVDRFFESALRNVDDKHDTKRAPPATLNQPTHYCILTASPL